uniref:Acyltransferase n=1 Tax=Chromera velia CCMP2878 TaxID=1169474 RepID=A0A0G4H0X0_9ALVE|eukprot:Cvel_5511.t1-p1 / transcript=Cvel_5511.t1 / gene=Cvel_5511 / organism=Chromera_velia_CCMP2878 / gene_product=Diacylglycerol O-acyltransferase 2, putative / transcript_product=Diacylglycerol O-acyltransferase 2, putative / location=Cvel_scaffold258:41617-42885(-) / protein_length=423 / sequence_SO=supercontig / SO=protein_coding / is_pseudo=false
MSDVSSPAVTANRPLPSQTPDTSASKGTVISVSLSGEGKIAGSLRISVEDCDRVGQGRVEGVEFRGTPTASADSESSEEKDEREKFLQSEGGGRVKSPCQIHGQTSTQVLSSSGGGDIIGAALLLVFVGTWVVSLFSPLIVFFLWRAQWHLCFSAFLILCTIAYSNHIRPVSFLQNLFAKHIPAYFGFASVTWEEELDFTNLQPTAFLCFPHGIFCSGLKLFALCTAANNHLRLAISELLFWSPLFRLLFKLLAKPMGVSRGALLEVMQQRESLAIALGGFEEATLSCLGEDRVFVKMRKGFMRLAIEQGYRLTPVFAFGENECFWNAQGLWDLRLSLSRRGVPGVAFWGRLFCPLLPRRPAGGLHVVVGRSIPVERKANPSREDVDALHGRFVEALQDLYRRHVGRCRGGSGQGKQRELVIW